MRKFSLLVALGMIRIALAIPDAECFECHNDNELVREADNSSVYVPAAGVEGSSHGGFGCTDCHAGMEEAAHDPGLPKVECKGCHAEEQKKFELGIHARKKAENDHAASCADCHGKHDILPADDPASLVNQFRLPATCGTCHYRGNPYHADAANAGYIQDYRHSIHGRGLLKSGLPAAAQCTDCHGAHEIRRSTDPLSMVFPTHIAATCEKCHLGIKKDFDASIHGQMSVKTGVITCSNCHQSHTIVRVDEESFKQNIVTQCGGCHEELIESYFETYHGKISRLGYTQVARCSDCHGSHRILPAADSASMIHASNVKATCQKCHPDANDNFAKFIVHADVHNTEKYPLLHGVNTFMIILLVSVFSFFGLHSLLWFIRGTIEERKKRKEGKKALPGEKLYIQRFTSFDKLIHALVVVSFLLLTFTGMLLKFSYAGWARVLVHMFGGFHGAGLIHRLGAIITFVYFGMHIWSLVKKFREAHPNKKYNLFWGHDSLVPQPQDVKDVIASFKWFFGKAPAPSFGRWTYWEKFDYFAVFWGVFMIGMSGLILWFPAWFAQFLPGWMINIAAIVHSEEAMLAVGFIFLIHFFNVFLRPNKFPVDTAMFMGAEHHHEVITERQRQWEKLSAEGRVEELTVGPYPEKNLFYWKIFGYAAIILGYLMVALIAYAIFSR